LGVNENRENNHSRKQKNKERFRHHFLHKSAISQSADITTRVSIGIQRLFHRAANQFSQMRLNRPSWIWHPYESRARTAALAASRRAEAMDLLMELAKLDGRRAEGTSESWIQAMAQLVRKRSNSRASPRKDCLSFLDRR
jgi:hypothetical protein